MARGERMGKSMGNFVTIGEMLRKHDAEALRLYYGMRHYRSQLQFDEGDIAQAEEVLDKLRAVYAQFKALLDSAKATEIEGIHAEVERASSSSKGRFVEAMDDDFNTPRALAAVIAFSKEIEPYATQPISRSSVEVVVETFDYFGDVFGILRSANVRQDAAFGGLVEVLVALREDARRKGDWATADKIRDNLASLGISLEDTHSGSRWYLAATKLAKA
jgi:cysteinyl-tRNA synthetase